MAMVGDASTEGTSPGKATQYETHSGVETLPSGGQFSGKSGKHPQVTKLFSNYFPSLVFKFIQYHQFAQFESEKKFFLAPSPAMVSFKSLVQLESVCFLMAKQTIKMSVIKLIAM